MPAYILTITCPDGPGIIHAVSGSLLEVEANVLEQEQYSDLETGLFFARTKFETPVDDLDRVRAVITDRTASFGTEVGLRLESEHRRALIMVSQYDHCLLDLLYRRDAGELPLDVVAIVSNHDSCRSIADRHGIPFHLLPVTPETKLEQESRMLELVADLRVDLVVLARYMQILSDETCRQLSGRVINIHHSFLPGFQGAQPYHRAWERGVKLIGATAHYVTEELDGGPIIAQSTVAVSHRDEVEDLIRKGRDCERLALARAVRLHLKRQVMVYRGRTAVFD